MSVMSRRQPKPLPSTSNFVLPHSVAQTRRASTSSENLQNNIPPQWRALLQKLRSAKPPLKHYQVTFSHLLVEHLIARHSSIPFVTTERTRSLNKSNRHIFLNIQLFPKQARCAKILSIFQDPVQRISRIWKRKAHKATFFHKNEKTSFY